MRALLNTLGELARLRLPVTAAAALATALAILEPFGLHLGGELTAQVTGVLVAVGVLADLARQIIEPEPGAAVTEPAGSLSEADLRRAESAHARRA